MTTQGIDLDLEGVKNATGEMYQAIENLRLSVRAVDSASDAARAGWKGDANASFVTTSQAWSDESDRINHKLDELTRATEDATQSILSMDEDSFIPGGGYTSL
ncbi:WXG100 family type VII secretion target [Nocardia sp. NPDC003963]